jgi:hypothetical protein
MTFLKPSSLIPGMPILKHFHREHDDDSDPRDDLPALSGNDGISRDETSWRDRSASLTKLVQRNDALPKSRRGVIEDVNEV